MADLESNLPEIKAELDKLVAGWSFTRPGKEASLGHDLAAIAADNIQMRGADSKGPGGIEWPPNSEPYRSRKRKHYLVDKPNIRTGQMLSRLSLLGDTTVSADEVSMKYGLGEPPERTATGAELKKADEEITDIEKAFFCSGARPFYGLDQTDAEAMTAEAGENLDDYLRENGGSA
jgi:hypothetical protein